MLSDLLRGHRLAAGLTQAELAARAGVGVRTVRDLERGRSVRPQRTTVELLADALDLTHVARTTFLAAARPSPADGPRPAGRHLPVTGPGAAPSGTPIALAEVIRLEGRYADAAEQGRRVAAALAELGDPGHRRRVLGTVGLALAQAGRGAEALEVVAELRSGTPGSRVPGQRRPPRAEGFSAAGRPEDAVCALIEGNLALYQGDRELAAEWFAAAVEAGADGQDRRDLVEALVGLAASTADVTVLGRLDEVRRAGGVSLLP